MNEVRGDKYNKICSLISNLSINIARFYYEQVDFHYNTVYVYHNKSYKEIAKLKSMLSSTTNSNRKYHAKSKEELIYKKQATKSKKQADEYQEQANQFLKLHNFAHFKTCKISRNRLNKNCVTFSLKDDKGKILKFTMILVDNRDIEIYLFIERDGPYNPYAKESNQILTHKPHYTIKMDYNPYFHDLKALIDKARKDNINNVCSSISNLSFNIATFYYDTAFLYYKAADSYFSKYYDKIANNLNSTTYKKPSDFEKVMQLDQSTTEMSNATKKIKGKNNDITLQTEVATQHHDSISTTTEELSEKYFDWYALIDYERCSIKPFIGSSGHNGFILYIKSNEDNGEMVFSLRIARINHETIKISAGKYEQKVTIPFNTRIPQDLHINKGTKNSELFLYQEFDTIIRSNPYFDHFNDLIDYVSGTSNLCLSEYDCLYSVKNYGLNKFDICSQIKDYLYYIHRFYKNGAIGTSNPTTKPGLGSVHSSTQNVISTNSPSITTEKKKNKYLKLHEIIDSYRDDCISDLSSDEKSLTLKIIKDKKTSDSLIITRINDSTISIHTLITTQEFTRYELFDVIIKNHSNFDCLNELINNSHSENNICEQVCDCFASSYDFEDAKELEKTTNGINNAIKEIKSKNLDHGITPKTISSVEYATHRTTHRDLSSAVDKVGTTQLAAIESGQNSDITRMSVGAVFGGALVLAIAGIAFISKKLFRSCSFRSPDSPSCCNTFLSNLKTVESLPHRGIGKNRNAI
ncbi:hypothetical protein [Wolbachia endosymbiont of Pentidionis agamae]|uniref:hypothetical protein n=1 Tax=Wolbachia endosymbiont of Pentidionis agamae TaxID=3110435 RepID=UPI002FD6942E